MSGVEMPSVIDLDAATVVFFTVRVLDGGTLTPGPGMMRAGLPPATETDFTRNQGPSFDRKALSYLTL